MQNYFIIINYVVHICILGYTTVQKKILNCLKNFHSWPKNESISPGIYFLSTDLGTTTPLIKSPFEEKNDDKESNYEEDKESIDVPITNLASNRSSITVG